MVYRVLVGALVPLLTVLVAVSHAWTARGCVDLDSSTFDKVVRKFRYTLVKFDTAFPYGDKHEAFTALAQETVGLTDDLLFALVGIKDYGEQDNHDLGRRFAVPKEYPVVKLFAGGSSPPSDPPIDFPPDQPVTVESLRVFLKRHTDLYIGLPGCEEQLDRFAGAFMAAGDGVGRQAVIGELEALAADGSASERYRAAYPAYVALMRKVDRSDRRPVDAVSEELQRVEKLLKGKLSDAKKAELSLRTNVMLSFIAASSKATGNHGEL